jgi:hypothetical protein
MAMKTSDSNNSKSSSPTEQDLQRQLIEQFHKTSIELYGAESEQTRLFAQHLSAYEALES